MDLRQHVLRRRRGGRHARWTLALLASVVSATAAADPAPCADLSQAAWLAGTWLAEQRDALVTETWTRATAATLEGRGVTRARADGTIRDAEDLRLVAMGDGVFYVAKVAHNALPVAFRLTACADGQLVFENAAHDFPRRIEYRLIDATRMDVHVGDGGTRGFRLEFRRQPVP